MPLVVKAEEGCLFTGLGKTDHAGICGLERFKQRLESGLELGRGCYIPDLWTGKLSRL